MKRILAKLLPALLVAALLFSPVASMEEDFDEIEAVEPVDATPGEQVADLVDEDTADGDIGMTSFESIRYMSGNPDLEQWFPDANFRNQVKSTCDANYDGVVTADEIAGTTTLSLYASISDLTGLEHFTSLTSLTIGKDVNITSLDVNTYPSLANLKELYAFSKQLTSLNLSGCTNLEELDAWDNAQLTALNVSGCTSLKVLKVTNDTLTSGAFNYSNCPNMVDFEVSGQLTSLDLSGMPNLVYLECTSNKLKKLDLSGCPKLLYLWCEGNSIKKLDISGCPKLVKVTKTLKHSVKGTVERYGTDSWASTGAGYISFDKGVKLITKSSGKAVTKKTKATAYVGTPYQLDLNGLTGSGFKSSNKKVATVNSKGVITPKAAGKTTISYKVVNTNYVVTLTVKDLTVPKYVVLNLKGTIAAKVGVQQTLTATMNDGAVSKLKWSTSDKKIATVKDGVVTFKKKGTVTITVTTVKGNKKGKVKFKVAK